MQYFVEARDGAQFQFERDTYSTVILLKEMLGWWASEKIGDDLKASIHGVTDETIEHVIERDWQAKLIEHFGKNNVGDSFAVDQHAVAVENDQLKCCHAAITFREPVTI